MSCQTVSPSPSNTSLALNNKPIHRHSHPMALVATKPHLESQQPRSYSLKSGVLPLKKQPQPKTSIQLPGVCCGAAQDKVPEKQRMRFGSTSSIPAVIFRPHHASRAMSRRSCGAVNEGLRMGHEQVGETKSGSSTASTPFASCNCCARCNHLMFMYSLIGPKKPDGLLTRLGANSKLFRSLQNALRGKEFKTVEEIPMFIKDFFASKPSGFFVRAFTELGHRWEKVVEYEGDYLQE